MIPFRLVLTAAVVAAIAIFVMELPFYTEDEVKIQEKLDEINQLTVDLMKTFEMPTPKHKPKKGKIILPPPEVLGFFLPSKTIHTSSPHKRIMIVFETLQKNGSAAAMASPLPLPAARRLHRER